MAYTQAYPLDRKVKDAFDLKVRLLEARAKGGSGAEEATYYFNARTPWIRMTSCVNLIGQDLRDKFGVKTTNALAVDYVLGTTKQGDAFAGHNYDKAYGVDGNSYGIRPQPGITNMNVQSYNKYGSLRKATVNFQVWTKQDLDACEILYMRPGMSLLLEWGWSLWVSEESGTLRVNDMGAGVDVLTPKVYDMKGALKAISDTQEKYNYGYDGILGFVKNFNWTLRPDGGYDCSTELVTAGELVESINMAKPLSDNDAKLYEGIVSNLTSALTGKVNEQDTSIQKFDFGMGYSLQYNPTKGTKLYQEAIASIKEIPSPETQTVLSAFINFDIANFADYIMQEVYAANKAELVQYQSLEGLADTAEFKKQVPATDERSAFTPYIPITTRIVESRKRRQIQEVTEDILRVNWINPAYKEVEGEGKKDNGKLELTEDGEDFVVEAKHAPQLYIKYGLILEIINNFMLQQGDTVVTPFDIDGVSRFRPLPNITISIDPSICLLPADESILRQSSGIDPIVTEVDDLEDEVIPNIYDIRINVRLLVDLLAESGLSRVSQEGTPYLRVFDMVQTLNTKINESTGGVLNLDIQYYDHLGTFSIVDRKTFSSKNKYNRLDVFGLRSLMHNINISSALTPDMSSQLAISAQTRITNADSHSAGFLRFNDGIQDRVIKDRSLDGVVVKNKEDEYANKTPEDFSEIFTLYELIYGKFIWADISFVHAKNKFSELVKTLTGNTETGIVGQVVIPFTTSLTMDGISGFHIMNGFTLDPKILPYKYGTITGGVGQIITGLEASIDSTAWKTTIKNKFYNLESGEITFDGLTPEAFQQTDPTYNYVYDFAVQLSGLDQSYYDPYVDVATNTIRGQYEDSRFGQLVDTRITRMQNLIKEHYEDYWGKGTVKETTDAEKAVGSAKFKVGANAGEILTAANSALQQYWVNYSNAYGDTDIWKNHNDYPWSAVYVSFMLGEIDFGSKIEDKSATPQGYGDPNWVKGSSHWKYVHAARDHRLKKGKGGKWVAFAIRDLAQEVAAQQAEQDQIPNQIPPESLTGPVGFDVPRGIKIKAQAGDVLVKARDGKYTNSHGSIVVQAGLYNKSIIGTFSPLVQLEADQVLLADGNISNTNTLKKHSGIIDSEGYYVPYNLKDYLIVLKRFE